MHKPYLKKGYSPITIPELPRKESTCGPGITPMDTIFWTIEEHAAYRRIHKDFYCIPEDEDNVWHGRGSWVEIPLHLIIASRARLRTKEFFTNPLNPIHPLTKMVIENDNRKLREIQKMFFGTKKTKQCTF